MQEASPNIYRTRVRSHQTDLNSAMYHGAYLDVFDDARIETFRRLDYDYTRSRAEGWSPVVRRIECDYFRAAYMDDLIQVVVYVPKLTRATMELRYECHRGEDLLAVAHVTFAFVNSERRVIRLPADLRSLVEGSECLRPPD